MNIKVFFGKSINAIREKIIGLIFVDQEIQKDRILGFVRKIQDADIAFFYPSN